MIAKVILIGKALGLGKAQADRTLALSVLRSSLAVRCARRQCSPSSNTSSRGSCTGRRLAASFEAFLDQGVYEILGRTLILFVAFIPFFAFWELGHLAGDKKLFDLFFRRGSAEADG